MKISKLQIFLPPGARQRLINTELNICLFLLFILGQPLIAQTSPDTPKPTLNLRSSFPGLSRSWDYSTEPPDRAIRGNNPRVQRPSGSWLKATFSAVKVLSPSSSVFGQEGQRGRTPQSKGQLSQGRTWRWGHPRRPTEGEREQDQDSGLPRKHGLPGRPSAHGCPRSSSADRRSAPLRVAEGEDATGARTGP